jgi:ABC-type sugar transport system permease subunit
MTKEYKKRLRESRKRLRSGRLAKKEAYWGLVFIVPWIVGALIFLAYPLLTSFWYALNNIRITPVGKNFTLVGYGNFTQILLSDAEFPVQLVDYILSTVISVPIIVVFAMLIAMMLNQNIRGRGFFRLIFFLPVIIVSGPILGMLTEQGAGSVSAVDTQAIASAISSVLPSIIAEPISDIFANLVTILWYSGVQILIFLSGLQKIDKSMYEAAKIDGGSGWECFWKITLPNLKSMTLLNTVYTIVLISTNSQNPIIELIKSSMFSGTKEKGYGYASAMAWLYSVVALLIVGLFALILTNRKDAYDRQAQKNRKLRRKEQKIKLKLERRSERNAAIIAKKRAQGKITSHRTDSGGY